MFHMKLLMFEVYLPVIICQMRFDTSAPWWDQFILIMYNWEKLDFIVSDPYNL